ncbi:MAG: hypothetical protein F6K63_22940 [Moorea sp. SIO1G6]|uniref:HigA protein (Antitoxin to HigB) n=1 Tax=Moorena producens (strain JHB) TaxID=1454205 RepID=A0A9Q9UVY1_MOOP1|nr:MULTISPECIES: hypothetical protein [Moorena]NET67087.1 hypothetical protein [Moorena sp. SIO1G6]WAN69303.1 hypothetical protein BJP36_43895 [Moorena producens JHB]
MMQTIQFHQILEMIDALSLDEQNDLINIVRHRQIEKRREEIAVNITKAHQEYQQGNVFRGTVDDVIAELNND